MLVVIVIITHYLVQIALNHKVILFTVIIYVIKQVVVMNKQLINLYTILQISLNAFNHVLLKVLIMLIKKVMSIIVFKNVLKDIYHLQYFKYQ